MEEDEDIYMNSRYGVLASSRGSGGQEVFHMNPKRHKPSPDESEYTTGAILRYFVQKKTSNNFFIVEIDELQFTMFSTNPFFRSISVVWRISPEERFKQEPQKSIDSVIEFNSLQIKKANLKIKGISSILKNPLEFYKKL